jgi:hypothetical protein
MQTKRLTLFFHCDRLIVIERENNQQSKEEKMNYSIEKSLIIAVTDEGNEFANSEHCDNLCIAAEYDDAIRVLYRASDFDEDRKNAYDSWEFLPIDDCPMDFGDGNAGTVAIAKIELGCGTRFIVFE